MAFRQFGAEETGALAQVIESQELWRGMGEGSYTSRFEDAFAEHTGRTYVLGVNSGTSANEAALAACGLEPGDEVIVPPCSFIASSLAPVALGAVPVFADVDPGNLTITAEAIEAAVTPKAKAVVVVHLWGIPADMAPILEVARRRGLKVIEDCAQAYDAHYRGHMVGTLGDVACYSLQQSKHITSGEGGLVVTDDPDAHRRACLYANCGMPWYRYGLERPRPADVAGIATRGHFAYGHNYRMSELQAAVALTQLAKIDALNARRAENVAAIEEELRSVQGLRLATTYPDTRPNYWNYPLSLDPTHTCLTTRDVGLPRYNEINYLEVVFQEMQRCRRTSVGYPLPGYVQYEPGLCPQAEAAAPRITALSVHPSREVQECRAEARDIAERMRRALA
jgi:dTDP-4-amino-4,6-dideoxygalactose transaminase